MREILFRGKPIMSKNEWVEGFYNCIPCDRFLCVDHCIQTIDDDGRIGLLYTVEESTVGQFTGLTDKNGKKIFEGDIVEVNHEAYPGVRGEVFFKNGSFMLKNVSDVLSLYGFLPWCKVIGNIHDNPELLEVSDGN